MKGHFGTYHKKEETCREATGSSPSSSCLTDAAKKQLPLLPGMALLQWNFDNGVEANSVLLPEQAVDQILRWRDRFAPHCGQSAESVESKENTA